MLYVIRHFQTADLYPPTSDLCVLPAASCLFTLCSMPYVYPVKCAFGTYFTGALCPPKSAIPDPQSEILTPDPRALIPSLRPERRETQKNNNVPLFFAFSLSCELSAISFVLLPSAL